ncbi:MAG: hypothetical protein PHY28_09250, partial [Dehalococcoidales bacterium]|nr:hypothetical protein [Dehalococcoidales bacterium]
LNSENRRRLKQLTETDAGYILGNPTDVLTRSELMSEATKIVADDENIDALILHIAFDTWSNIAVEDITRPAVESILKLKDKIKKPIAVALICQARDESKTLASEAQDKLSEAGFPVYPSIQRAAVAISRYVDYCDRHRS